MKIRFYWHRENDDLDLGEGYVDQLPPAGALVAVSSPETDHVCWRVVTTIIYPAQPGSLTAVRSEFFSQTRPQLATYGVFVEPAEGPFHP